jgi:hypothetical protein
MTDLNDQAFHPFLDTSITSMTSDDSLPIQQESMIYIEESELRPPAMFMKGYTELNPYEATAFGEVVLKKTKNGKRAKSGVKLERSISPKRPICC